MSEQIEPTLSAEEWVASRNGLGLGVDVGDGYTFAYLVDGSLRVATEHGLAVGTVTGPARIVAVANAALCDDDPRKITRDKLAVLLGAFGAPIFVPNSEESAEMKRFLDALESYLPPGGA